MEDTLTAAFPQVIDGTVTQADLARMLRWLRRRDGRRRGRREATYRELATRAGWSHAAVGQYLTGVVLPPADRFDVLIQLLGATPAEQRLLATIRDRLADGRTGGGASGQPAPASVPRELPPAVTHFVGRARELARLDESLAGPRSRLVVAITGTAGIGKTMLAVHWAHRVADRFPDGQLYVDLRGYDPGEPRSPAQVLARFLRSLGVDTRDLPDDADELAAHYRTALADRRVLVLLDNARDAEQVRPLVPGTPHCLVVVTSRDDLSGLVVASGALRVEVDPLPLAAAVELLDRLLGDRGAHDPAARAALARRCGGLPLALRLAAEVAASRPGQPLRQLVAQLDDGRGGLSTLACDSVSLRSAFAWSYRCLPPDGAAAFALLGLHPGPGVDDYALAALAGTDLAGAAARLRVLARANLVRRAGPHRFALPDLLRAYAAECAAKTLSGPETERARSRLLDYYRSAAAAALNALDGHPRLEVPAAQTPVPVFDDAAAARSWLHHERATVIALWVRAADLGLTEHATDLGRVVAFHGVAQAATTWQQVDAGGEHHVCGIKTDGSRWCWGGDSSGQLGLGDTTMRVTPAPVLT